MTWPADTERPDALLTAARILDKRMARIHELSEYNHQLKDQITRLQSVILNLLDDSISLRLNADTDEEARSNAQYWLSKRDLTYRWGDLDPID